MSNVVSLAAFRTRKNKEVQDIENDPEVQEYLKKANEVPDFKDAEDRNAKNEERVRKERLDKNKSVLRSYRIKN